MIKFSVDIVHSTYSFLYLPLSCGGDRVDALDDAMQGAVRADGHVRAAEIIVDGTDQADNIQVLKLLLLFRGYSHCKNNTAFEVISPWINNQPHIR